MGFNFLVFDRRKVLTFMIGFVRLILPITALESTCIYSKQHEARVTLGLSCFERRCLMKLTI